MTYPNFANAMHRDGLPQFAARFVAQLEANLTGYIEGLFGP